MRSTLAAALTPTVVVLAGLLAASGPASADLTGKWRIEDGPADVQFVDVIDVAGAISMTVSGVPLTGTVVGSDLTLSGDPCLDQILPTCPFHAVVFAGEDYFDGTFFPNYLSPERVLGNRCECFDGNTIDGDGCDATCRVEACFTCTGMPSSCTPTPNGGSCSDHSACTTGETCTAGVCSGVPVTSCVDLSGLWITTYRELNAFPVIEFVPIEQWDDFVLIRRASNGYAKQAGTIDPATGFFSLDNPSQRILCPADVGMLSGTAALDNMSFTASGTDSRYSMATCRAVDYIRTGIRTNAATMNSPITVTVNFSGATVGSLTYERVGDSQPSSCSFRHGSDSWNCNDLPNFPFFSTFWEGYEAIWLEVYIENSTGCRIELFADSLTQGTYTASLSTGCNEAIEGELALNVPTMTSAMAAAVPGLALIGVCVLIGVLGAAGYRKLRDQDE